MNIYSNNQVSITGEYNRYRDYTAFEEMNILCNGESLIVISSEETESFRKELSELLDKYRI